MSIAFVVLKLEGGGQLDPFQGVTGSRNSQGGIGLTGISLKLMYVVYARNMCSGTIFV